MTHITQQTASALARKTLTSPDMPHTSEAIQAFANAAIDHYIDSLSAELPEPDYIYKHEDIYGNEVGPPELFYSASTVRALLAARGAKIDHLENKVDKLEWENKGIAEWLHT